MTEATQFSPNPQALAERALLGRLLKAALFCVLMALGAAIAPDSVLLQLGKWALLLALGYGIIRIPESTWTATLTSRQAYLRDSAVELRHGDHTRILVFASLRHVKMIQSKDERVLALELHTDDDTVTLRNLTNLELLFAAISAQRPKEVMIEVEEQGRFDKDSPKAWIQAIFTSGIVLGLLLNSNLERQGLLKLNALLMLSSGLGLAILRPLSTGSSKKWMAAEIACGALLAALGALILFV